MKKHTKSPLLQTAVMITLLFTLSTIAYANNKEDELSSEKVYAVYLKHNKDEKSPTILTNAKTKQFLGKKFIVAKSIREYLEGSTIHIPVDNIAFIVEYKDIEHLKKVQEKYNNKWGKESPKQTNQ